MFTSPALAGLIIEAMLGLQEVTAPLPAPVLEFSMPIFRDVMEFNTPPIAVTLSGYQGGPENTLTVMGGNVPLHVPLPGTATVAAL